MKMLRNLTLFIALFSSTANASWYFLEPAVGYYQGHYQTNKLTGLGLDLKLGVMWGKMFIGADVGYASALTSSKVTYDVAMNNTGLALGWTLNDWRLWYVHVSSASLAWKSGASDIEASGSGYKLGVSTKLSGSTHFNLEANFLKYDEKTTAGTSADVDEFMDLVFMSISWPY